MVEAAYAQAEAWGRVADALEAFAPAAETLHGFGDRLDQLCQWLKGKWPWIAMGAYLVLQRTVNMAPEDLLQFVHSISEAVAVIAQGAP